jgi:thiol-disulfide isomerase/thioredoxin
VASTRRPKVVVYHAPGCHLCETVLAQLDALEQELDFELDRVNIAGDDALEATYREWLPVVEIDGRRRFTYYLQVDPFRTAVAQAAAEA